MSDAIEPGWWYIRTDYDPGYEIVYVLRCVLGPDEGKLWVFSTDQEGPNYVEDYGEDLFISMVPSPFNFKES